MKTATAAEFAEYLHTVETLCAEEEDIVSSKGTVRDFLKASINCRAKIEHNTPVGTMTVLYGFQLKKGQPRKDLYILSIDAENCLSYAS